MDDILENEMIVSTFFLQATQEHSSGGRVWTQEKAKYPLSGGS